MNCENIGKKQKKKSMPKLEYCNLVSKTVNSIEINMLSIIANYLAIRQQCMTPMNTGDNASS